MKDSWFLKRRREQPTGRSVLPSGNVASIAATASAADRNGNMTGWRCCTFTAMPTDASHTLNHFQHSKRFPQKLLSAAASGVFPGRDEKSLAEIHDQRARWKNMQLSAADLLSVNCLAL
ncbi:unnamed protein product [Heligmosomoides polygyrus]|uniref:Uncharacterized protein n=1 Tax=Heligmosomoides polygyrus TaxID=6339 RepID=A0A183FV16_HELPZ|nr:unnamed protein product [Heligmosomoides polygyrus]